MINEIVDYEYDPKSISNRPGYSNIVNNQIYKGSSDENSSSLILKEDSKRNEENKNDFAIEM